MPPFDRRLLVIGAAIVLVAIAAIVGAEGRSGSEQVATATDPPQEPPLVVHVAGAVRRPGLYRIERGARVADAIEVAGGFTRRALHDGLNLATPLVDGQQVRVPERADSGAAVAGAAGGGSASDTPGPISLSQADARALETLPGIGPATAAKIIAWREGNGGFAAVDDLLRVPGIGSAKLEALRPLVVA